MGRRRLAVCAVWLRGLRRQDLTPVSLGRAVLLTKLVVFGPTPPPFHGVSVATELILEHLGHRGYDIAHIETRRPIELGGRFRWVAVVHDLKALAQFIRQAFDRRPDIVYLPISQTILGLIRDSFTVLLARTFGTRVVVHLHGAYLRRLYDNSSASVRWVIGTALRRVSGAIVLGESLRSIFSGLLPEDRIYVVPNGIPRDTVSEHEFELLHGQRSQRTGAPLRVVYLSNLMESKGYLDLLRAAGECKRRGVPVRVSFAGAWVDGSRALAKAVVAEERLESEIEFLGIVTGEAKWSLLAQSDVFVLPTANDGQPISILEAMASGLPVITTRVGCIEDMVRDGINGYLVEPRNPMMLASKLGTLYRQPDLRLEMGRQSRKTFEKGFSSDEMMRRLEAVFEDVLSRSRR